MISKIRIKNFKAIKDSGEIILSPFTAIIGRNGSGKSSLIEAIEFLHDLVSIDLEHALQKWKSYKNILYNGNREQFDVTMDSLPKDMPYSKEPLFQQSEDLETSEEDSLQNNYEIENEEGYFLNGIFFSFEDSEKEIQYECLIVPYTQDRIIFAVERALETSSHPTHYFREIEGLFEWSPSIHPEGEKVFLEKLSLYNSILSSNKFKDFDLFIYKIQILNLNSFLIGDPVIKYFGREDSRLFTDGSNLLSFLFWIQKYKLENFNDIKSDFLEIINYSKDLDERITSDIQNQVYYQLSELRDGETLVQTPSWLMSTGSQKILALLSIIHNPNPSSLIIIEEFENGLDPWTISYLIKKFKELKDKTKSQVIITTHSPTLLNILEFEEILFAKRDNERGTLEYVRFDEEKKMFDDIQEIILPGELYEKIRKNEVETEILKKEMAKISNQIEGRDKIKCLIFTEDESKEKTPKGKRYLIEVMLEASGFRMDEIAVISFKGKNNIKQAILSSHFIVNADYPNIQKAIFHLDRDVNNDKDKDSCTKLMDDTLKHKGQLFYTKSYDIESYFLNPEHINKLIPTIKREKIREFTEKAIKEKDDESFDRFDDEFNDETREFLAEQKRKSEGSYNKKNIKSSAIRKELRKKYEANSERYIYGKGVFHYLCDLIKTETKVNALVELLQPSEHIKDSELEKIAKEIWG